MTRKSNLLRRCTLLGGFLILLLGFTGVAGALSKPEKTAGDATVTVFLLRHAEKSTDDPRDPSLSEMGHERAKEVAHLFGATGVTHLFSTDYKRTRQTLQPLAELTALKVALYDPRDPGPALKDLPDGAIAVFAGHSNTTPGLYAALSGREAADLEESAHGKLIPDGDYDRVYALTLRRAPAGEDVQDGAWDCLASFELRYGAPSAD